jgi:hypothetical protein
MTGTSSKNKINNRKIIRDDCITKTKTKTKPTPPTITKTI